MSSADALPAALIEALPDLVLLIRRDGVLLGYSAGHAVSGLRPTQESIGKRVDAVWSDALAELLKQLARKAIALRATAEARFQERGQRYEARASAQGPDRAICVIRPILAAPSDALDSTDTQRRSPFDRRSFLQRFRESMSLAALRDKPIALAAIHLDGLADIAQVIAASLSEQILSAAIQRLPASTAEGDEPSWYLGQVGDSLLALVIDGADHDAIATCVGRVCQSLREPLALGGGEFHLTPYAGVAIFGRDASTPKLLLDHARAAAAHARRAGSAAVRFFTDTLELKSLARLDIARELHAAIENRDIGLRYIGRYELASGRLVAWVGYLRWQHPLRGEILPAEFLRVAEATGLAAELSRAALARLPQDFAALCGGADREVRVSFGALRHHILHERFVEDIQRFVASGAVPAERLELRVAEKTFIAGDPALLEPIAALGVRLVVDEVARGMGSLDRLARAPLWGLQLDRAWMTALRTDAVAQKVCRAGIGMASALGLTPVATGVDDPQQREALLSLGCRFGSGDLYPAAIELPGFDTALCEGPHSPAALR